MELRRPFGRMLIASALLIAVALAGLGASSGGDYQLQFDAKLAKQKPTPGNATPVIRSGSGRNGHERG